MHSASGIHLQAGLLALDAGSVAFPFPSYGIVALTGSKNVHHSGASASDSHRLPYAEIRSHKFSGLSPPVGWMHGNALEQDFKT
jgi:hypothetical protein